MAWTKGMKSPNPSGRPSAIPAVAKKILAETKDFSEVITFALDVLRGTGPDEMKDAKSRRWAADFLGDRCLGKPAQRIDVSTTDAPPRVNYDALTDEELEVYERLTAKLVEASLPAPAEVAGDGDVVH